MDYQLGGMTMNQVAVFGVPRSGTTWLCQIFNSHPDVVVRYQPLFSYGHKGALTERSSSEEIDRFYQSIVQSSDEFATMRSDWQKNFPVFEKSGHSTHIVFKETRYLNVIENMLACHGQTLVVGIVRNPLSVLASWVNAPKEYNPDWDLMLEWRDAPSKNMNKEEEFYGFARWKEMAEKFLFFEKEYPESFLLVRYDHLNRQPQGETNRIFDFCGLSMCDQVNEFITESKSRHDSDPYSVYRSRADDKQWKNVLPEEIVRQVRDELAGTSLESFLCDGSD